MKVLFTGGGTAGHINPALAAAGYLRQKEPDAQILYVGNKGGMEERLVPQAGFEIKTVHISGFQRKLTPQKPVAQRPDRGAGVHRHGGGQEDFAGVCPGRVRGAPGATSSGPVIREAAKLGIPCVIHESNAYPGVTTKMLAKSVKTVMLAVPDAKKYLDPKAVCTVTGNPVRGEVLAAQREESRKALGLDDRPLVLSFGGSLGASALNRAAAYMLAQSAKEGKYQHIHGYGAHDEKFLSECKEFGLDLEKSPQIQVLTYIDNMPQCLSAADLVIGRAGAMTLSEIEAKAKASIPDPLSQRGGEPPVPQRHGTGQPGGGGDHRGEGPDRGAAVGEGPGHPLRPGAPPVPGGRTRGKMETLDANERIYRVIKAAAKK